MIHPSTLVLIDKLCEMTRQKKIAWQMGEDGTIVHDTEGYRVILSQDPQELILADALGRELERADVQELAETMTEDGRPYAEPVGSMIRDAARVAKGTEFAIEKVLASLDLDGDGIPDLPPPPGMEALIEEELGDAPTAEEIAAVATEDITEETSPFIVTSDSSPVAEEVVQDEPMQDVASAVQQMADKINGGTVETTTGSSNEPNFSGFGAFAAGTTALGAAGIAANAARDQAENAIETTIESVAETATVDITAPAKNVIETAADTVEEVVTDIRPPEAPSQTIGRIDDIEGTMETVASEMGSFQDAPSDTSAIADGFQETVQEASDNLSEGEQSIASLVESFTAPEAAETTQPAPDSKPLSFSLSGIAKGAGVGGVVGTAGAAIANTAKDTADKTGNLAESAKDNIGDTLAAGTEAAQDAVDKVSEETGELSDKVSKTAGGILGAAKSALGDAKDAAGQAGENISDGARKVVDDIGDAVEDTAEKAKPTTRFNPWN